MEKRKYYYQTQKRYWERRRGLLIKRYGSRCFFCGSKQRLEFAHIAPTNLKGMGRGKERRIIDITRNPFCYELLCHMCHRAYDGFSDGKIGSENSVFGTQILKWNYE
jgi:predicted restriction endonuclease